MRNLLVLSLLALGLQAQTNNHTQLYFYSGSNLQYVCDAPSSVTATTVSRADGSLVSIVVSSNVGTVTTTAPHQLVLGAQVQVIGATALGLNTTYTAVSIPSSTTYTITTAGVADGTYSSAGLLISTNSPLLTSAVWAVTVFYYNGSVLQGSYPGGGSLSLSSRAKCSDRALY